MYPPNLQKLANRDVYQFSQPNTFTIQLFHNDLSCGPDMDTMPVGEKSIMTSANDDEHCGSVLGIIACIHYVQQEMLWKELPF